MYTARDNVVYWKTKGKINNDLQCALVDLDFSGSPGVRPTREEGDWDLFLPNLAFKIAHRTAMWVPDGERMCHFARRIARDEMCILALKDGFVVNACLFGSKIELDHTHCPLRLSELVSKSSHTPVGDNSRILSRYLVPIIRWRGINLTHLLRIPTESKNMSPIFGTPLALRALYSFWSAS